MTAIPTATAALNARKDIHIPIKSAHFKALYVLYMEPSTLYADLNRVFGFWTLVDLVRWGYIEGALRRGEPVAITDFGIDLLVRYAGVVITLPDETPDEAHTEE